MEFAPDYRRYTDVTIFIYRDGETEFYEKVRTSKAVLSAYSEYFYKLFTGAIGNPNIEETKLYVENVPLFLELLEAFYDGQLYNLILNSSCKKSLALLRMCSRLEILIKYKKLLNQIIIPDECFADFIQTIEETLGDPRDYFGLIRSKLKNRNINLETLEDENLKSFLQYIQETANNFLVIAENSWIILWNFSTGEIEKKYYFTSPVSSLSLSPDGTLIAVGEQSSSPNGARILSLLSSRVGIIKHNGNIISLAFSPDGQKIASINNRGLIKIHTPEGEFLQEIENGENCSNYSVAFFSDNERLLVTCEKIFKIWDTQTKILLQMIYVNSIANVSISPDDTMIAYITHWGGVNVLNDMTEEWRLKGSWKEDSASNFVLFSPDKFRLALATDKQIKIYNTKNWKSLLEIPTLGVDEQVKFLAFSPSGSKLASVNKKGEVMIWDSFTGELLSQFQELLVAASSAIAFSPLSK